MTTDQLLAKLEALLAERRERKMGDCKVVPVVSTSEMDIAGTESGAGIELNRHDAELVWSAMIAAAPTVHGEPFAWATFDGEGSYELRLYEENEDYRDKWLSLNPGPTYRDWVRPLYTAPQPAEQQPYPFRGDSAALIHSAQSLLSLDDKGALSPNGIGGHTRNIIKAFIARFSAEQQPAPDVAGLVEALEQVMYCNEAGFLPESVQQAVSDALAAHRKGDE